MANIDLEKIVGTDQFPNNENDVYALIETIASQRIMAVQSANRLIDATYDYVVENGQVIQEAVIEMAKSYAYDKSAYDRAPKDPTLHVRYFSDYTERQFEVTVRRDDVRKIIANKGEGVEDVIAQILSTLTSGEGHEDFENVRALILNEYVPDYSAILGGVPKNIKGCIYAARNMYNHLKSDNSDLTEGAGTDDAYISATPAADIRVAITESLLNLMDVVELANIFNLEKEELFGILVVVPDSDLDDADKYKIVVYDRKAMGRATFIYDFTQEEVAKGRFRNEYLTVSRAYFYNELFKAAALDCIAAATAAIGGLISSPFDFDVSVENGTITEVPDTIDAGEEVEFTVTAGVGYDLPVAINVKNAICDYNAETGKAKVYNAIGDVDVSIVCVSQAAPVPVITLAALEITDIISTAEGGVSLICNINKTKEETQAIIHELVKDETAAQGVKSKYLFGGASTYPYLRAFGNNVGTEQATYGLEFKPHNMGYGNLILWSTGNQNNGWALTSIDMQTGRAAVGSASNAVGTLAGNGWNGVLVGKPVSE